jgi:RND family efflux transporter MFP subunit
MKLKSRRFGFLALGIAILLAAAFVVKQRMHGESDVALAATDSTAVSDSAQADSGKKGEKDKEKPVPVETVLAEARDLPSTFGATGSLEARREVDIISKAQGQVVKLNVEEGRRVAAGDVLLELDHREEEIRLKETAVRAETAQREMARLQGLLDRGLGSERDFEQAKRDAEVARCEHELAQVDLDNKIVKAPFPGLVSTRSIELGQTVNPGEKLVGLADVSPLLIKLYLPEQVVRKLRPDQPVEIRPDVAPDHVLAGEVERIAPTVDPSTSTVKVTLKVGDLAGAARVGSFVRARITTDVHRDAVSVPKKALVPEAGATYLFVAEADTVRKVPVTTGYSDDDFMEITEGVAIGERVVTVGQGGLSQGSRIRDLDREPERAKSGADRSDQDVDTARAENR